MIRYRIEIKDKGRDVALFKVFDTTGRRVPATFRNKQDALEACAMVYMLRTDNVLEYVRPIQCHQLPIDDTV
jgi:hypothetical protein